LTSTQAHHPHAIVRHTTNKQVARKPLEFVSYTHAGRRRRAVLEMCLINYKLKIPHYSISTFFSRRYLFIIFLSIIRKVKENFDDDDDESYEMKIF
jgi:hypothetical protein